MSKKSTKAYTAVFEYIEKNIMKLQPVSFTTDYETAMRNALRKIYAAVELIACWFHYTQALRRRCAALPNFFPYLRAKPDLMKIYYKMLAVPLLPPDKIREAVDMLEIAAANHGEGKFMEPFFQYFRRQWLTRVSPIDIYIYIYLFVSVYRNLALT